MKELTDLVEVPESEMEENWRYDSDEDQAYDNRTEESLRRKS
jgi:hypothetical protein